MLYCISVFNRIKANIFGSDLVGFGNVICSFRTSSILRCPRGWVELVSELKELVSMLLEKIVREVVSMRSSGRMRKFFISIFIDLDISLLLLNCLENVICH